MTALLFLGDAIRERLEAERMKQSQLAAALGVDSSIPSLWARNRRPVSRVRLPALARVLHTTASALMGMAVVPEPERPAAVEPAVVVDPEPEPEPEVVIGRTLFPLSWCSSMHGTGVYRLHHHGPQPPWAQGVERIDEE